MPLRIGDMIATRKRQEADRCRFARWSGRTSSSGSCFQGQYHDTKTVSEQVRILAKSFGVKEVTLVGDRGMIKGPTDRYASG